MLRNLLLLLSLSVNAAIAYVFYHPTTTGARMTCEQARSDIENKRATEAFAAANNRSVSLTHAFLSNSGFQLRNIDDAGGNLTCIYVVTSYSATCGLHLPGADGGIVRVRTSSSAALSVEAVF
jgi:hypothetical protein